MQNYRTTLGGALSALGTTLVGIGVVPQLAGTPSELLKWLAITGFILSALGKFFSNLFAADAKDVAMLKDQMVETQAAVRTGDTSIMTKKP